MLCFYAEVDIVGDLPVQSSPQTESQQNLCQPSSQLEMQQPTECSEPPAQKGLQTDSGQAKGNKSKEPIELGTCTQQVLGQQLQDNQQRPLHEPQPCLQCAASQRLPQLRTRAQQLQAEAGCSQGTQQPNTCTQQLPVAADCSQSLGSTASAGNAAAQCQRSSSSSALCNGVGLVQDARSCSPSAPCSAQVAGAMQIAEAMANCLQPSSDFVQPAPSSSEG